VAALPLRPADPGPGGSWTAALAQSGLDERDRATDRAQSALSQLANAITQLARGLLDKNAPAVNGAGMRLRDLPQELAKARADGAPAYAGVGDTLPARLDELAALAADLLEARRISPAAQRLLDRAGAANLDQLARHAVTTRRPSKRT